MTAIEEKLVEYIDDAYAMEQNVLRMLDGMISTTDEPDWWEHQFGSPYEDPERFRSASPDLSIANVRTPMLVIHGNMDYRVPISEALQLWTDLRRHDVR